MLNSLIKLEQEKIIKKLIVPQLKIAYLNPEKDPDPILMNGMMVRMNYAEEEISIHFPLIKDINFITDNFYEAILLRHGIKINDN